MSEAFWKVQNARTAGYYIGKDSMNKPLTREQLNQSLSVVVAEINGEEQGEDSMNEQIDNVSENSEDSITRKACRAWVKWALDNNITEISTQPETYTLMSEAFIDGYLNGFTKRFTEGE